VSKVVIDSFHSENCKDVVICLLLLHYVAFYLLHFVVHHDSVDAFIRLLSYKEAELVIYWIRPWSGVNVKKLDCIWLDWSFFATICNAILYD